VAGRKKSGTDQKLLAVLGVCLAVILLLLPFHAFFSTWGGTTIGPLLVWKSWKEIILLALVPIVVWLCVLRPDVRRGMWRSWLNKAIALYVVVTLVMAVGSSASTPAIIAGLLMNLRFLAMFVLAEVLVVANPPWLAGLKKWLTPWMLGTGILLSALAMLQVTVVPKDFLSHFGYNKDSTIAPYVLVDQDPNALRAFATMRGPNTLAAYLLLPLALALLTWWQDKRKWWAFGSAALMVVALGLTGSRSAWLGAAAMLVLLAFATLPRAKLIRWIKFGTIPIVLLAVLVLWLTTAVPALRLAIFHSGGNGQVESLTEGSSDKHWQATLMGIEAVVDDPLGQGIGTAGPASFYNDGNVNIPEDYFVQIGQETGLFGLAVFLVASVLVWRNLWINQRDVWGRALLGSFIGLTIVNLFLHGWADDPTAMTWWALAGLFIVKPKE
jgi:hypothetical protein